MYVAVKGGERAIENAHRLLAHERRGDRDVPELSLAQISEQLSLGVDRVMTEGSLYDRELAALAIKQARGDLIEAIFLVRAFRATLPRFGATEPVDTGAMQVRRRVSSTFKDIPGGQILGPTFDYTHRLLDPQLAEGFAPEAPATGDASAAPTPRVTDILGRDGLIEPSPAADADAPVGDLTREPLNFPADRDLRLQNLARADEGFLLALGYSSQRGYGRNHPFAGEIRFGEVADRMPDGQPVQGIGDRSTVFYAGLRSCLRAERAQDDVDGAGRSEPARPRARRGSDRARPGRGIRDVALGQCAGDRLRRTSQAAALR
jgi:alpha-D-ribose 1-methylphosphonate 5-triphosphate synthase subunit PhnI